MLRDICPYCNNHVDVNDEDTAILISGKGVFRTKILLHGRCYLLSLKENHNECKEIGKTSKENE